MHVEPMGEGPRARSPIPGSPAARAEPHSQDESLSATPDPVTIDNECLVHVDVIEEFGLRNVTVEIWDPNDELALRQNMQVGGPYEVTFVPGMTGSHVVKVIAIDESGNVAVDSLTFTAKEATKPPTSETDHPPVTDYLPILLAAAILAIVLMAVCVVLLVRRKRRRS